MPGYLRTLALLAVVLDVPLLGRGVRLMTPEPRAESLELDRVPVEVVRPGRGGPWPAFVFVTGAHPQRRNEPVVRRVSRGLARAGYLVLVPDLPGLGEGEIGVRTLEAAVAVTRGAIARPDVRGSRVALCGASAGARLALLAAGRPEIADHVSIVVAISPFADLERIVCLGTTCFYDEDGTLRRYEVTGLLRRIVARSMTAALPAGADRDHLLEQLRARDDEDRPTGDSLELTCAAGATAATRAVLGLLTNADPARFAELLAAVPEDVRALLRELSPARAAAAVRAPVELAVPPHDPYFPIGEAKALAAALPSARLTVTPVLDHTRPTRSARREVADFGRFVARSLTTAAA